MPVKLNGATSGYAQLQAAAVASSNTLTLPNGNGMLMGQSTTTAPTNGQIPIGNGTDYTPATLTQGSNITITNAAGSITIAATVPTVNSAQLSKAWARWDGTTGTIAASYNVSSVTRNSTGDYTVTYTSALANSTYAIIGNTAGDAVYGGYGGYLQIKSAPTTTTCAITTRGNSGTYYDSPSVQITIFGA